MIILRFEIKFKISILDFYIFKDWLHKNIFLTKHYQDRRVNSLYFDTQGYLCANENISGISERFKLRARWYCKDFSEYNEKFIDSNTLFRVELKKKRNLICDKILLDKFFLKPNSNYNKRLSNLKKKVFLNCSNSIFLKNFNFNPVIFVSYSREYYQLFGDKDVRVTIDNDIRYSSVYNNVFHWHLMIFY